MSVIFNGATCYPVGNAQLSIVSGKLKISNIGNTGLDGVTIMVPEGGDRGNNIAVSLDKILYNNEGSYTESFQYLSKYNTIYTDSEIMTFRDGDDIYYGFNSMLMPPNNFNVFGTLNGNTVFDEEVDNEVNPAPSAILGEIYYGVKLGLLLYKLFKKKQVEQGPTTVTTIDEHYTKHPDGSETYHRHTTIDPEAENLEVIGDQTYTVDTWGVKKSFHIPSNEVIPPNQISKLKSYTLKGKGFSEFEIYNIAITPVPVEIL